MKDRVGRVAVPSGQIHTDGPRSATSPRRCSGVASCIFSRDPGIMSRSSDTELHVFEGKGHSLTIDGGWKDVADVALDWLTKKGF